MGSVASKKNNVHKGGGGGGENSGFKINLSLFQRSYFLVLHELQINIQTFMIQLVLKKKFIMMYLPILYIYK